VDDDQDAERQKKGEDGDHQRRGGPARRGARAAVTLILIGRILSNSAARAARSQSSASSD
jgi:hypothetical protein